MEEKDSSTTRKDPQNRNSAQRWGWIVIGTLTAVAVIALGVDAVKYRFVVKRWGVVEPGRIYRSGQISKWLIGETLKKHGIEVVIDLNGIEKDDEHQAAEIATTKKLGVELHRFPLAGNGTGDIGQYAAAIRLIHESVEARRPVLVHCSAGAQRTGGVVACYRMLIQKKPPAEAYSELLEYEWDPDDDQDLTRYVNSHMGELTELLVSQGVLDEVPNPLPRLAP